MAAGKPVIVSSVVPMADFVKKNTSGVLVDDFSADCLVRAVNELRSRYEIYLENVAKVDMNLFSSEKMVNSYLDVYQKVCGRSL